MCGAVRSVQAEHHRAYQAVFNVLVWHLVAGAIAVQANANPVAL
jgi:hypothetical protein